MKNGRITIISMLVGCLCMLFLTACSGDDTYKLAKKIREYKLNKTGYEETLKLAEKGNYDANCRDCFNGADTSNISLFAYACMVDYDIARAIYENGADIEIANSEFYQTPLLAALDGNRNNVEIVYWLIEQGANINVVDYDNCSVFNYIRYWDDNEETQELIGYLKNNCDIQYLKEKTTDNPFCSWDEMWDEDNQFVFFKR